MPTITHNRTFITAWSSRGVCCAAVRPTHVLSCEYSITWLHPVSSGGWVESPFWSPSSPFSLPPPQPLLSSIVYSAHKDIPEDAVLRAQHQGNSQPSLLTVLSLLELPRMANTKYLVSIQRAFELDLFSISHRYKISTVGVFEPSGLSWFIVEMGRQKQVDLSSPIYFTHPFNLNYEQCV